MVHSLVGFSGSFSGASTGTNWSKGCSVRMIIVSKKRTKAVKTTIIMNESVSLESE